VAKGVLCDHCAAPEEWGLEKTEDVIFGIHRFRAKKIQGRGYKLEPSYEEIKSINKEY